MHRCPHAAPLLFQCFWRGHQVVWACSLAKTRAGTAPATRLCMFACAGWLCPPEHANMQSRVAGAKGHLRGCSRGHGWPSQHQRPHESTFRHIWTHAGWPSFESEDGSIYSSRRPRRHPTSFNLLLAHSGHIIECACPISLDGSKASKRSSCHEQVLAHEALE